jgi:protease-4
MSQDPSADNVNIPPTEGAALMKSMLDSIVQQQHRFEEDRRRDRFWRNMRALLLAFGMVSGPLYFLWIAHKNSPALSSHYAAMVRVQGVIGADESASAERIVNSLDRAFNDEKSAGVVLLINSPGGSPVQAAIIRDRLIALRTAHPDKKVWAVGEDMLTSGAYFVAVGAPKICVNPSTLTGSIGVIRAGWGFNRLIDRLGIERRIFTAGSAKSQLDSFEPLRATDRQKADELLKSVHEQFKGVVRAGRAGKLHGSEGMLFSGDFWTGDRAVALGLVDSLCTLPSLLEREYGVEDVKDYTLPPSLLDGITRSIGVHATQALVSALNAGSPELLPRALQ